jgi:xylulokinase
MGYVIGCDVGSQAVKAIMVSSDGKIVGESSVGYPILFPKPAWAEQPAISWTDAVVSAISNLRRKTGISSDEIVAIGLDGQVDGFVPIDSDGEPLHPAIIWMDRRAVDQTNRIALHHDPKRLFRLSGLNLDPYHVAPKIKWFADAQAELYDKSRYFLLPGSYVAYYLTGNLGVDYSNASSTLLMDVNTRAWSPELCDIFQIDPRTLPPIYPANHVLGTLRSNIAEQMGLRQETLVILGSGDEHAASLGAGVVSDGLICDIGGTAEPVCAASRTPIFDEDCLVETHCHAHPDLWLVENPGFVSGGNFRWFRDNFGEAEVQRAAADGSDVYDLLNQAAEKIPPGSEGLIMTPTLMGSVTPTWNALARGVFFGFTLKHTREHFLRALLEGSAYALRDITDRMREIGLETKEIRAVGGGARSDLWRQMKADVTGIPVSLPHTTETTALGAALLAIAGSGLASSFSEAVDICVKVVETRDPDPITQEKYEKYYQLYRSTYFALEPIFEQAAKIEDEP